MQRPQEDEEAGSLPRPDEQRGHVASNSPYAARSPPGAQSQSSYTTPIQPYSPPNGLTRRPSFSNQYQPSTPAQLPLPANLHGATSQTSPLGPPSTAPIYQSSDYTPAPRDKPASNYYDPTSDSSAVKPNGQNNEAHQVGPLTLQGMKPNFFVNPLTDIEQNREPYNSYSASGESNGYVNGAYSPANANVGGQHSPTSSHSHPSRLGSNAQPATMPSTMEPSTGRQSNGAMDIDNMVSPPVRRPHSFSST